MTEVSKGDSLDISVEKKMAFIEGVKLILNDESGNLLLNSLVLNFQEALVRSAGF